MDAIIAAAVIFLVLAIATNGFTDFVWYGWNNKHKFCEKCHRRVRRVSDDFSYASCIFGLNTTYECKKCGHRQTAHSSTYD